MDPAAASGAVPRPSEPLLPGQVPTVDAKEAVGEHKQVTSMTDAAVKAPLPVAVDVKPTKLDTVVSAESGKVALSQEHDDNDDVVVQPTTVTAHHNGTLNGDFTSLSTTSPPKKEDTLKDKEKQDKPGEKVDPSIKPEEPCSKVTTKDSQQAVSVTIDSKEANGEPHSDDDRRSQGADASPVNGSTDDKGATPSQETERGSPREDGAPARELPATVKALGAEEGHDSGVDESTQAKENGQSRSPSKGSRGSPRKRIPRSSDPSPLKQKPTPSAASAERKAVPMNKIEVGKTASPNLKAVKSKIGSMDNAAYKPGGGKVKIESKKLDFSKTSSKIAAKNVAYTPGGGDKKIESQKLKWNVSSKIGSLENKDHKPGGGDKKIESQKLVFKAQPKVGSRENIKHKAGGGDVQIEKKKLDFKEKASSKVGSLNNVQHKAGGGDKKIFDDKDYLKQIQGSPCKTPTSKASSEANLSRTQSPSPALMSPATQDEEEVVPAAATEEVTPTQ